MIAKFSQFSIDVKVDYSHTPHSQMVEILLVGPGIRCFMTCTFYNYSRLSLSRSRRDPLKRFEISVLRHIRCAELRKIPIEQPNITNKHVI